MSFADEAAAAIGEAFTAFSEAAIIDPDGAAVQVRLVRSAPDEELDMSGRPVRRTAVSLELRAADAALATTATVIEIGVTTDADGNGVAGTGERRVVQGEPEAADRDRRAFLIDTRPE